MLRKFFAYLFLLLFVLIALPLSLLFSVWTNFDRDFFSEEFVDLSYEFLTEEVPKIIDTDAFPVIEEEDVVSIISESLTKEDVGLMVESVVTAIETAEISSEVLSVTVPVMFDEDGAVDRVSRVLLERLPECDSTFGAEDILVFDCVPPNLDEEAFIKQVEIGLDREVLGELPSDLVLEFNVPVPVEGNVVRYVDGAIGLALTLVLIVEVLLLFLVGLLIFRPVSKVLAWEMKAVFFASLLVLFVVLLIKIFGMGWPYVDQDHAFYSLVYNYIFDQLVGSMGVYAFVLMVVSLIIWLLVSVYGIVNKEKENDA